MDPPEGGARQAGHMTERNPRVAPGNARPESESEWEMDQTSGDDKGLAVFDMNTL